MSHHVLYIEAEIILPGARTDRCRLQRDGTREPGRIPVTTTMEQFIVGFNDQVERWSSDNGDFAATIHHDPEWEAFKEQASEIKHRKSSKDAQALSTIDKIKERWNPGFVDALIA